MTDQTPAITSGYAAELPLRPDVLAADLTAALLAGTGMRFVALPEITGQPAPARSWVAGKLRARILRTYRARPARTESGSRADTAAAGLTLW